MRVWKVLAIVLLAVVLLGALGTAWWIWRAFYTNRGPSRLEVSVARTALQLAIPPSARREKDPLEATSGNLAQGRNNFLTYCSRCHGVNGSGRTPMGRHLYPRVPDLRRAATQSLTDGEIHYIIQHGVPLTGMPGWRRPQESAVHIWPLVLYIRSLRPLTREEKAEQAKSAGRAHYVGSEACAKCHASIYERWKKTPMANVVRDPQKDPNAILADFSHKPSFVTFTKNQIAFVYGNIWKQNYFTKVGNLYYPLPAKWDIGEHKWLPYLVQPGDDWWERYYPLDDMKRPTLPLCDGCHSVNLDLHAYWTAGVEKVTEWNVGCERCHGPGSEHVKRPSADNIINPAQLDSVEANDVCIQCHVQGRPRSSPIHGQYYDWPVGFHVGLRLRDFWQLEPHRLGVTNYYYYADGTAHKNRMQGNDFVQSLMYRHGVTCFDCHDVHGTKHRFELRRPVATMCLECHGPGSPNGPYTATIEEHTHHPPGNPGSRCVACHMPKIETELVPGAFAHAHTFRFVTPAMTEKYGIPNPCITCHKHKTNQWATSWLDRWYSPWRMDGAK